MLTFPRRNESDRSVARQASRRADPVLGERGGTAMSYSADSALWEDRPLDGPLASETGHVANGFRYDGNMAGVP